MLNLKELGLNENNVSFIDESQFNFIKKNIFDVINESK